MPDFDAVCSGEIGVMELLKQDIKLQPKKSIHNTLKWAFLKKFALNFTINADNIYLYQKMLFY